MKPSIRGAVTSDVHAVVELIHAYATEVFSLAAEVTPEALLNDGFGIVLEFLVADTPSGELIGFAAWEKTYDVVAGARGGALLGLYVRPDARQQGIGHALLAAVTREVRSIGGSFLVGLDERPIELSESARPSLRAPRMGGSANEHVAADLVGPTPRDD